MGLNKEQIKEKIKEKKELGNLDDSLVHDILEKYLDRYKLSLENLDKFKIKIIVKEIRAELRLYAGRFQKSLKDRMKLLEEGNLDELLKTHTSTSERLEFYPKIKELLKALKIRSVLDLGCGINPIVLANKEIEYNAIDINNDDLILVRKFFEKNDIKGKVFAYDLRKIKELPKADICIIFKTLDILEKKPYNLTERIIKIADCKYFLISFATKTISGKPMKYKRRKWFEILLKNLEIKYEILNSKNEIFYSFSKSERH
ncbi:MAG: hypothetical protein AABX83_00860 [Nanoarchaeota archaeon]